MRTERSASADYCRAVTAQHGRSYYLASRLLPPTRRRAVYALYAFARTVDDAVDVAATCKSTQLQFLDAVEEVVLGTGAPGRAPESLARVLPEFFATVDHFAIPRSYFTAFLTSMRMDVSGTSCFRSSYRDLEELRQYMYGSAVVIGLQLLPVLGTVCSTEEAAPYAGALGEAFQLTNFLRDVGEDLDRGRVYLPMDTLAAFGVDRELLDHCRRTGTDDHRLRRALAHFIALNRDIYRQADKGMNLLDPRVRPGIRAARDLYGGILDEIERRQYRVLSERVVVAQRRRLLAVAPHLGPWTWRR